MHPHSERRSEGRVHESPQEHRFYMDFVDDDDEEELQDKMENSDQENEEDGADDIVPENLQWPQSYRKSMDIYSHIPSPGLSFLSPNVSRSSLLSTSFNKHLGSTTSIFEPLLLPKPDEPSQEEDLKAPSRHIIELPSEPKLIKAPSVKCPPDAYPNCHLKLPEHGCSFLQSTVNGINVLAGVGVLSTPYALKQGGWIGLVLLLLFALICCYTGILLRKCLESGPGLVTYPDIGQAAFGRVGRLIISIILYTELYACCVEFLILEGDNLASLFPAANFSLLGYQLDSHIVFTLLAALFILPTVWLRDLSLLSYISAGGVLSSVIVVFSVLWVGAFDGVGFHNSGPLVNFGNLPVAIGLFGFCFSGHAVFPNIYSSMRNESQFNQVLQVCFLLCILMYGGVAVMGYRMFGAETSSQVTLNLPKQFVASKIALWTTVITPLTKYALTITPVALSLEELLPNTASKHHWASVAIRTALVASTLCVALLVPFFGFVMAFIGSFLSLTGSLILPCACYLSIQGRKLSATQAVICVITILIGAIAAVTGTYSSVSGIIGKFRSG